MRKAFLLIALALSGAPAASGQSLSHCSERYEGHVSAVRVETARYVKVGGEWVEGPRRLGVVTTYSDDRRRSERTVYDDAGNASDIYVSVCYGNGRYAEIAHFDGARSLRTRTLLSPDGNLIEVFDAAGSLEQRAVIVRDGAGHVAGQRTYDGAGKLTHEEVREREARSFVSKRFDGGGRLLSKTVSSAEGADGQGRIQHDVSVYGPDGLIGTGRETTVIVEGGRRPKRAAPSAAGGRGKQEAVRYEKDGRGNVIKITQYELNQATGEMEPRVVRYYEITYF